MHLPGGEWNWDCHWRDRVDRPPEWACAVDGRWWAVCVVEEASGAVGLRCQSFLNKRSGTTAPVETWIYAFSLDINHHQSSHRSHNPKS